MKSDEHSNPEISVMPCLKQGSSSHCHRNLGPCLCHVGHVCNKCQMLDMVAINVVAEGTTQHRTVAARRCKRHQQRIQHFMFVGLSCFAGGANTSRLEWTRARRRTKFDCHPLLHKQCGGVSCVGSLSSTKGCLFGSRQPTRATKDHINKH